MPAEIGDHPVIPQRFMKLYDIAATTFMAENGSVPTHDEVIESLGDNLPAGIRKALGSFGLRLYVDRQKPDSTEESPSLSERYLRGQLIDPKLLAQLPDADEQYVEVVDRTLYREVDNILGALSEREASIIRLHFGIDTPAEEVIDYYRQALTAEKFDKWVGANLIAGEGASFDAIGRQHNISGGRASQIETKVMAKLRARSRGLTLVETDETIKARNDRLDARLQSILDTYLKTPSNYPQLDRLLATSDSYALTNQDLVTLRRLFEVKDIDGRNAALRVKDRLDGLNTSLDKMDDDWYWASNSQRQQDGDHARVYRKVSRLAFKLLAKLESGRP